LTSASTELFLARNWTLTARFEGEFADRSQRYVGIGTLRYLW
jgi:uncharacterized protein with beta-barrel porin domain